MQYEILRGDCLANMRAMPANSVDSIVTDPPYELTSGGKTGFMGKAWDGSGIAFSVEMWREALRLLKPGGHLLAFSGSRTYHRMTCAIEDAGFDIRDQIMWVYGSGFPKSLDVSKAIDKAAGATRPVIGNTGRDPNRMLKFKEQDGCKRAPTNEDITAPATDAARQWEGWGTALKPAHEPICVARKPLIGTVAANVLAHGTGALNIDGCRVAGESTIRHCNAGTGNRENWRTGNEAGTHGSDAGRWPANLIHSGIPEDWARYFYCAKASKADRGPGNTHPTVKPQALMRYLVRLVTPPGGLVLDPFAGSGSTVVAALTEGFRAVGIELLDDHADICENRADELLYGDML